MLLFKQFVTCLMFLRDLVSFLTRLVAGMIFLFLKIYLLYIQCSVSCMAACQKTPDLITDGCWKWLQRPLEEQLLLLTAESSLQPIGIIFFVFCFPPPLLMVALFWNWVSNGDPGCLLTFSTWASWITGVSYHNSVNINCDLTCFEAISFC